MRGVAILGIAFVAACAALPAQAFVADGALADWGAFVADDNQSWLHLAPQPALLGYMEEDTEDWWGDAGIVGPHDGGQDYDAELMAVGLSGGIFSVAIVSGQRPDNGFMNYAPGDLRIETSAGTYWVEIGGGAGGYAGFAEYAGGTGSTYRLDHWGYTNGHFDTAPAQVVGSIWSNVDEVLNTVAPLVPTQFKINANSVYAGNVASYVFTRDAQTSQHSVIELSIDAGVFGNATIESFHWRPSCDNDELDVNVPEPASLSLLLGGATLLIQRRRGRAA